VRSAVAGPHLGAVCDGRASRGQGDALLNLFYPDHDAFWLGLLPGVPAVLAFLCSGRRQRSRGCGGASLAADLAQIALLCWQPCSGWRRTAHGLAIALVVADIVALLWLLTNPVFAPVFARERLTALFADVHSNKR
jgi:hypothetical protein